MKKIVTTTALLATAAGGAVLVATPAHADVDRTGRCAGATFELSVDRERGGFEVDAEVDRAKPGSAWRVALRHDGKLVTSKVRDADREGEIDVDAWRRNTAGSDTFTLTVTPAGGSACSVKVTV